MIVRYAREKIKGFAAYAGELAVPAMVFLVGIAAFGLGRLSALEEARPAVSVRTANVAAATRAIAPGGEFVASRSGSAYYYPWCSGAERIKPQNQRWFSSEEAARAAGYRSAKNCKGLGGE